MYVGGLSYDEDLNFCTARAHPAVLWVRIVNFLHNVNHAVVLPADMIGKRLRLAILAHARARKDQEFL